MKNMILLVSAALLLNACCHSNIPSITIPIYQICDTLGSDQWCEDTYEYKEQNNCIEFTSIHNHHNYKLCGTYQVKEE